MGVGYGARERGWEKHAGEEVSLAMGSMPDTSTVWKQEHGKYMWGAGQVWEMPRVTLHWASRGANEAQRWSLISLGEWKNTSEWRYLIRREISVPMSAKEQKGQLKWGDCELG